WAQVNNRIPANLNVQALATNGALVFAGSVYGVFRTSDDGATWEQINAGLTDTFATALTLSGDDLIAGTIKGGVFLSKLSSDPRCQPNVTGQPVGRVVSAGQTAQLQVTATSASAPAYQWYRGLSGDTANPIPGATRASYTTGAINAAESYWVLVSNACGTVSSETATIVVNTPPRVDLALTQTITPVQARPGDDVSFTLNVTNRGQDAAFAVTVTDALPSQVTLTSCEATGGGVCGGAGNNRTVTFASLAAGASATITLRAKVNVGVSGVVRNTASAGAGAGESDLLNNLATASLTVAPADPNAPFISALSPATATAGGAGFTLTVNGANFVSGAQVRWNGGARQTAFGSATLLTAQIPASDIATAGTAQVTVVNPNGNVSNAAGFAINAPQLTPTLTTLIPNSTQAGGAAFTLTLLGTNFAGSAQVRWNGSTRQTVFGSSTLLTAQIPATDIATAGTAQVTVDNSNGNVSGPLTFTISAQPVSAPTLTILSPNSAAAGGAGFTLTVNGTNFVSGAQVRWNGAARATSFVSATQLTAQISAADVANAGVANVTVVAAGGATSNVLPFSINSVTACTYAVTPTFRSFSANGGTATATVTAPAGCEWSVQSLFFGASITSGSSGSGNGTVTFSVAANTTGFGISGSLLIAGQYVLMTQSSNGGNCPPESFSIGGNLIGSLASGDCRSIFDDTVYADLYTFTGQAGQRIAASLTASSFDTFLVLIGPTGTVVDFNDDDVGNNSRIPRGNEFLVLPETGTYLLEVSSFNSNATGVYSLSLISTPAGGVCSYAVTPSVITVGAAGGTATVNVSTTNTCGWTARSSFAQISSGSSGFGSGTVGLSITANTSASRRVGSVLVAGQYVPVIQSGNANDCTVASLSIPQTVNGSLSATDCRALVNSERYADVYTFTGRAGQRIAVTMSSAGYDTYLSLLGTNGDFVAVDDNGGGGTNSRIPAANGYFVLPYTGLYILEAREIFSSDTGDYTLSLTTASDSVACNFALTPTNRAFTATGGTGTISVTSTSGCNWAAESSVSWLTIVGANTGSGNGVVNFTAATNNGPARTGTLLVAGQVFTVTQEGGCTFTISPTSQNLSGDGGSGTVNVTAGAGCTWTATSNAAWLMIAAGTSGSGAASVAFVAAANPNTTPRTGTLTVAGQTFTVTQAALQCSYAISPASQSFNATGGNGSVNVTAPNGCAWTAASNDSWITINSGATSSGNGAVSFTVAANTGGARNGSLLIVGQVFAVSQDSGCTFTISPTSQTLSGGSGSGTVNVTAATGCTWTAVSNAAWLTITAGASGSGAGAVTFTAASNPTTVSRTGTLTIAGQTFSAIQAAGSFPPTISSLTPNAAQAGGVGFALTVAGTNFVAGSKVRWNGGERPTTFGSATQLTAQIPAADIATAGSATVTVANPDGSISAGANFTITPPPQTNRLLRVVASNNQGSTVAVPIELISQGDENAVGFSLTFDPAVLGNPQASLGSDAAGGALNQSSAQAAQGRLGLVLALPAGQRFAAGTRQIAVINFTVAAGDSATTANINFGDQPVAREVSDVNGNVLPANYAGGAVTITRGFEADVAPRPSGNGTLSVTDWVLVGRFASGDLAVEPGSEFQRTDCAPRSSFGNGAITVSDWVQAGRYAAGLDPLTSAAGPTAPGAFAPTELSAFLKPSGWPRLLRLSSPTFGAGQTSAVTIELLAQGEENAVGFSLQFDSRQWRFVSATLGEDAQKAALSVNAKFAADGHVGFALALPPGQKFDAGMRSLVTVNFVAAENGSGFAPEVSFSDWPAARELADAKADVLAADWMPAAAREPANVSSASLAAGRLARGSLATAFGNGLAVAVQQAEAGALPKTLAGTSVTILDSAGAELVAPLFFVSPGQVNYLLPAETATGRALVRIVNGDGVAAGGLIEVVDVAPGLFATDASGKGLAAALALRVKADGSLSYEAVSRFDAASGRAVPVSIDLGNPAEQVFLILFGTGFRGRSSLAVTLQVGGLPVEASYVGPQGEFAGLDQINLALPRALAGRGEVTVNLTVDGKTANSVTIAVK
ncbi:MAG TPA: BACON domain-containing carbohydrate-binding protein, partial [Blastocatellia bacterium]|nr:BACON domain-containing carbohydrate-binding protein [Blastocatellia bacterium]